ncbi:MAG: hypothetical protein GXZ08_01085 [Tissierellia bacterium]|nr:hypothetical protein [Tissierellia bacterium]
MSKFLAPIHHMMYDKILFLDTLTRLVLDLAHNNSVLSIKSKVDILGKIEKGELEDMIDQSNIHDWLNDRIQVVEKRFAYSVSLLLLEKPEAKDELLSIMHEVGKDVSSDCSLFETYELIMSKFLDGMPCDRAVEITNKDKDSIRFKFVIDTHSKYWDEYENSEIYWELREACISGILENTDYELLKIDDKNYELRSIKC